MSLPMRNRLLMALACFAAYGSFAQADDTDPQTIPQRPAIDFYRWQEDWSVLADPRVPREPGDVLKYIPLSKTDPKRYLSFGVTLRERFEDVDPPLFGTVGGQRQDYLLHRLEVHADAQLTDHTRVFIQLENALSPWLKNPSPVDANKLDLRLAFLDTWLNAGNGVLKIRVGRQE